MRVSSNFRGEVGLKPGLPAWTPAKRRKRCAPERGLQPASTRSLEPLLAIIIDTLLRSKNRFRMKIRSAIGQPFDDRVQILRDFRCCLGARVLRCRSGPQSLHEMAERAAVRFRILS